MHAPCGSNPRVCSRRAQTAPRPNLRSQAAKWLEEEAPEHVREHVIGPLIMHIDVPDASHQPLVEEAIGPKHAFSGFLAKNDQARNEMTKHVNSQRWKLNVYKNSDGARTARRLSRDRLSRDLP